MAWDVYYQIFVARFLESFPHRDVVEVKRKIQSMLIKRQLKVQGEEEYWSALRKDSAHFKGKGDPFTLYRFLYMPPAVYVLFLRPSILHVTHNTSSSCIFPILTYQISKTTVFLL